MSRFNKRHYPHIAELPIELDYDLIEDFLWEHYDKWQDNYTSHRCLAVASNSIASDTYKDVETFHLPECKKEEDLEDASAYTTKDKISRKIPFSMDEHNWNEPVDFYKDSTLQQHLNGAFQDKLIRVRFSRLHPGGVVPPHIDYNTTYAMRVIIPLSGNKGVENHFWVNGEHKVVEMRLKRCYFLNIGYRHAVYHKGNDLRHYLIASIDGQKDFECISLSTT